MMGVFTKADAATTKWAEAHNPFYDGPNADWLALIPFVALDGFLYLVGREACWRTMRQKRIPRESDDSIAANVFKIPPGHCDSPVLPLRLNYD